MKKLINAILYSLIFVVAILMLMSMTSCSKYEVLADNVTVDFSGSVNGNDVVKFTNLQNGHIVTFSEQNGVVQTGKLNENHLYKIEWTQNAVEQSSCAIRFAASDEQELRLYELPGAQTATLDSTSFAPYWSFDINCR